MFFFSGWNTCCMHWSHAEIVFFFLLLMAYPVPWIREAFLTCVKWTINKILIFIDEFWVHAYLLMDIIILKYLKAQCAVHTVHTDTEWTVHSAPDLWRHLPCTIFSFIRFFLLQIIIIIFLIHQHIWCKCINKTVVHCVRTRIRMYWMSRPEWAPSDFVKWLHCLAQTITFPDGFFFCVCRFVDTNCYLISSFHWRLHRGTGYRVFIHYAYVSLFEIDFFFSFFFRYLLLYVLNTRNR